MSARRPRRSRPESLGGLLPRVLEEVGLGPAADSARLLGAWQEALGPELAPHCQLDGVRRGVIWANVRDSAWMQRIQLEKPRILARLERAMGRPIADDLRLRVGWRA